jgi:8-oxo-dGTP pyrophosphatase MutT (NUDIX family)
MNLQGYQRHIINLNHWHRENFKGFFYDSQRVGYLKEPVCSLLAGWSEFFGVDELGLHLKRQFDTFEFRTQILSEVTLRLQEEGVMTHHHGEQYPVTYQGRERAIATVDRAAAPYFGLRAYGQHLNGYVRKEGHLYLWTARRSDDRRNFPNRLDNMVAGGLPYNISLADNLRKECMEEASIPGNLADQALAVGALTYCIETPVGLKPDTLYCYDLELPPEFKPRNSDGEVAEFMLMPVEEVAQLVAKTDEFKPNCNLVVIDFLVRHGNISPEAIGYLDIVWGLHGKL